MIKALCSNFIYTVAYAIYNDLSNSSLFFHIFKKIRNYLKASFLEQFCVKFKRILYVFRRCQKEGHATYISMSRNFILCKTQSCLEGKLRNRTSLGTIRKYKRYFCNVTRLAEQGLCFVTTCILKY